MKKRSAGFYFILAGVVILLAYSGIAMYGNGFRNSRQTFLSPPTFECPSSNAFPTATGSSETNPPKELAEFTYSGNEITDDLKHCKSLIIGSPGEAALRNEEANKAIANCDQSLAGAQHDFDCFPEGCQETYSLGTCTIDNLMVSIRVKATSSSASGWLSDLANTLFGTRHVATTKVKCYAIVTAEASGSSTATCSKEVIINPTGIATPGESTSSGFLPED